MRQRGESSVTFSTPHLRPETVRIPHRAVFLMFLNCPACPLRKYYTLTGFKHRFITRIQIPSVLYTKNTYTGYFDHVADRNRQYKNTDDPGLYRGSSFEKDTAVTVFLGKFYLIAAAGALATFILSNALEQDRRTIFKQAPYQEEAPTGMHVFVVRGPRANMPQKLINELNNKGDHDEKP